MRMNFLDACPCCGSIHIRHTPAFVFPFVALRIYDQAFLEIPKGQFSDIQMNSSLVGTFCIGCANCGFIGNAVRYTREQMSKLYSDYRDDRYDRERTFFEPSYAKRAGALETAYPYLGVIEKELYATCGPVKSVIDVGGASGINCPFRSSLDTECFVSDVSGKDLLDGVNHWDSVKSDFDLVYCSNVLEHIPDILGFVESDLMRFESRYIYVEVPYFDPDLDADGFPQPKLGWHEHINYFSEQSLDALCERLGLNIVKVLELGTSANPSSLGVVISR